jgi:HKD family nuclease
MKIVFLYQGVKDCKESVGSTLLESLSNTDFEEFKCLSAFASQKGVNGLKEAITKSKEHIKHFSVIVGIDQNGTSKEALEALLNWDIGANIYYTSSPIIFHPKVYIFNGKDKSQIIVGSSNITKTGLFQNVEASLKVDINKPDPDGEELIKQVNTYLEPFFEGKMGNLQKLTPELIQQLVDSGIIPTEAEKKKKTKQERISLKEKQDSAKMDAIKALFPTVPIQATPEGFKAEKPTIEEKPIVETEPQKIVLVPIREPTVPMIPTVPVGTTLVSTAPQDPWAVKGELLWEKILTRSDVLQAKAGTNPTGCLRLTQGKFNFIDQTKYFREDVFGKLNWAVGRTKPAYVEVATVNFYVKILGRDFGLQEFTIRHKPSGEANQNNYTTSLSWGNFSNQITTTDLSEETIYLYAPQAGKNEPFYIEIGQGKSSNSLGKWFG